MFSLANLMFINTDTLNSLQILQSEFHPNTHMQGPTKSNSGAKESLSVYGLFRQLAHTPQGKHKLRQVFLRPSLELSLIQERHNTIAVFLRSGNADALDTITHSLKRIKNIRAVLIHLMKGVSAPTSKGGAIKQGIWGSLQQFTFHSLKVVDAIRSIEDGENLAIVGKVFLTLHLIPNSVSYSYYSLRLLRSCSRPSYTWLVSSSPKLWIFQSPICTIALS